MSLIKGALRAFSGSVDGHLKLSDQLLFDKVIGFRGVIDGVGCSTVVQNVAIALASETKYSICVLDTSVLAPAQYGLLDASVDSPVKKDWFDFTGDLSSVVSASKHYNIYVLGFKNRGVTDLLSAKDSIETVTGIMKELKKYFDIILVDLSHELSNIATYAAINCNRIYNVVDQSMTCVVNLPKSLKTLRTLGVAETKSNRAILRYVRNVDSGIEAVLSDYHLTLVGKIPFSREVYINGVAGRRTWGTTRNSEDAIEFTKTINTLADEITGKCDIHEPVLKVSKSVKEVAQEAQEIESSDLIVDVPLPIEDTLATYSNGDAENTFKPYENELKAVESADVTVAEGQWVTDNALIDAETTANATINNDNEFVNEDVLDVDSEGVIAGVTNNNEFVNEDVFIGVSSNVSDVADVADNNEFVNEDVLDVDSEGVIVGVADNNEFVNEDVSDDISDNANVEVFANNNNEFVNEDVSANIEEWVTSEVADNNEFVDEDVSEDMLNMSDVDKVVNAIISESDNEFNNNNNNEFMNEDMQNSAGNEIVGGCKSGNEFVDNESVSDVDIATIADNEFENESATLGTLMQNAESSATDAILVGECRNSEDINTETDATESLLDTSKVSVCNEYENEAWSNLSADNEFEFTSNGDSESTEEENAPADNLGYANNAFVVNKILEHAIRNDNAGNDNQSTVSCEASMNNNNNNNAWLDIDNETEVTSDMPLTEHNISDIVQDMSNTDDLLLDNDQHVVEEYSEKSEDTGEVLTSSASEPFTDSVESLIAMLSNKNTAHKALQRLSAIAKEAGYVEEPEVTNDNENTDNVSVLNNANFTFGTDAHVSTMENNSGETDVDNNSMLRRRKLGSKE